MGEAPPLSSRTTKARPLLRGVLRVRARVLLAGPVAATGHLRVAAAPPVSHGCPPPPDVGVATALVDVPLAREGDTAVALPVGQAAIGVAGPPTVVAALTGTTEPVVAAVGFLGQIQARPCAEARPVASFPLTARGAALKQTAVRRARGATTPLTRLLGEAAACATPLSAAPAIGVTVVAAAIAPPPAQA